MPLTGYHRTAPDQSLHYWALGKALSRLLQGSHPRQRPYRIQAKLLGLTNPICSLAMRNTSVRSNVNKNNIYNLKCRCRTRTPTVTLGTGETKSLTLIVLVFRLMTKRREIRLYHFANLQQRQSSPTLLPRSILSAGDLPLVNLVKIGYSRPWALQLLALAALQVPLARHCLRYRLHLRLRLALKIVQSPSLIDQGHLILLEPFQAEHPLVSTCTTQCGLIDIPLTIQTLRDLLRR